MVDVNEFLRRQREEGRVQAHRGARELFDEGRVLEGFTDLTVGSARSGVGQLTEGINNRRVSDVALGTIKLAVGSFDAAVFGMPGAVVKGAREAYNCVVKGRTTKKDR